MKKYIYTVMLILTGITMATAQRMLPKQKGMEIHAGTLSDDKPYSSYYLSIGMTINGKNGNYKLWALEYSRQNLPYKHLRIPLEIYTAEGGYSFFLLGDARKNITLNAGLSGIAGYESINRGDALLQDGAIILSEDSFVYGGGGRLSFETYLSDHFVLLLQGHIKVLFGTDLEQFRPSAGAGIRFNF
ncbi:conjugal transfer protein TraO [Flavobacterium notoginsengisoli]|uniref:conjugal transfer protein TraO n=1 Tax=Flavobacterium notoginsengisoli TaxID=1478199 RepID=UPI003640ADC8